MSHGIHGFGHGKGHHLGLQRHGSGQFKFKKAGSGEHKKLEKGGAAPAEKAGQAGGINEAMAALDQAINNLAVSLNKDSYNGQEAPAGVQPVSSGLTNPGNIQADSYTPASPASLPSAPAPSAPAPARLSLNDPLLQAKGGGALSGGVVGSKAYLEQLGGGALSGGVVGSKTNLG